MPDGVCLFVLKAMKGQYDCACRQDPPQERKHRVMRERSQSVWLYASSEAGERRVHAAAECKRGAESAGANTACHKPICSTTLQLWRAKSQRCRPSWSVAARQQRVHNLADDAHYAPCARLALLCRGLCIDCGNDDGAPAVRKSRAGHVVRSSERQRHSAQCDPVHAAGLWSEAVGST